MLELAVLTVLILALAVSLILLRRRSAAVATEPVWSAMNRKGALTVIVVVGLASSAAGCALNVTALCEGTGGTYAGGTCTRWSPAQQAAQDGCQASGGVYLRGGDTCHFGAGDLEGQG